jgi:hypothetical protein
MARCGTAFARSWVLRLSPRAAGAPTVGHVRSSTLLAAALIACAAASPTAAQAADRAAARGFARATERLNAAVLAQRAPIEAAARRLDGDPVCVAALDGVPDGEPAAKAFGLVFVYAFQAGFHPLRDALARFSADLDRVRVRDRALRAGRAAWRREARAVQLLRPAPEDICAQLDAWRQAGYPPDAAPPLEDDPGFAALGEIDDADRPRIARAGRRLRRLGAPRAVTRAWGGHLDDLLDPLSR